MNRHQRVLIWRIIVILSVMLCAAGSGWAEIAAAQSGDTPLLLPSQTFEESQPQMDYHPLTGKVTFLSAGAGSAIRQPTALPETTSPEAAARSFLKVHGALFGLQHQAKELVALKVERADRGRLFVRFQQVYNGIRVLGGELIVQMDAAKNILSVNGKIAPDLGIATTPSIPAETARQTALAAVAEVYKLNAPDLTASPPELLIYDPVIVRDVRSRSGSALAWRTDVRPWRKTDIKEFVLIDAHSGSVMVHFNQIESARNRRMYHAYNTVDLPGTLVRTEFQGPIGDPDVDNAYLYVGDAYNFYRTYHGRDSINNAGMTLVSTAHYDTGYCNAFWDGAQMAYGDGCSGGTMVADDVVAHEYTHGVTDYTSQLFYQFQSGAINESFSDIWGEFVDLANGRGNDNAAVRWLIGEDTGPGAIRNMQNPPQFSDPDRILSPYYYCGIDDIGGVHTNSGVGNKTASLLTDGGAFNGYTITGLGMHKVVDLFYEVQTHLLTSTATYLDLRNALNQACLNLGYSAADCQQVQNATLATEMDKIPCASSQLLWTRAGEASLWTLNAAGVYQNSRRFTPGSTWTATSYQDMKDGSGTIRILWTRSGAAVLWTINAMGDLIGYWYWAPGADWTATSYDPMPDGTSRILWTRSGAAVLWTVNSTGSLIGYWSWAPGSTWIATGYQLMSDGMSRILWTRSGEAVLWTVNSVGSLVGYWSWAPGSTWTATGYQPMSDGTSRILWTRSGAAVLWMVNELGSLTEYWAWTPGTTWTAQSYYVSAADGGAFKAEPLRIPELVVRKAGNGQGTIAAGGQICGPMCQELRLPYITDAIATLQVTPAAGSLFARWETIAGVVVENLYYAQPGDTVMAVFERE